MAPAGVFIIEASSLGSNGGFNAVSFTDEEVPAENLTKAVHHVVQLVVLHVQKRTHGEPQLGYLGRCVVSDSVLLKQILQTSQFPRPD